MYQARSLIGSDASGLSDPYAQIIFCENSTKTQVHIYYTIFLYTIQSEHQTAKTIRLRCLIACMCLIVILQVIDETLSPTWDELLIINEVILYGTKDDIKKDPPTIVVEIFDQDKVVTVLFCKKNVN